MADPDRLFDFVQVAEEFDDVLVAKAREALVRFAIDVLDIHEQRSVAFMRRSIFANASPVRRNVIPHVSTHV